MKKVSLIISMLIFVLAYKTEIRANDLTVEIDAKDLIKSELRVNINGVKDIPESIDNRLMFNEDKEMVVKVPNQLIENFTMKGYKIVGYYDESIFYTTYDFDKMFNSKTVKTIKKEGVIIIGFIILIVFFVFLSFKFTGDGETEIGGFILVISFFLSVITLTRVEVLLNLISYLNII